jgi:hypothetical protein
MIFMAFMVRALVPSEEYSGAEDGDKPMTHEPAQFGGPTRHFPLGLGTLLLVAVAIGCSGSDAPKQTTDTAQSTSAAPSGGSTADTCGLVSQSEVTGAVGNPVLKGRPFTGSADCQWETEKPESVSVLLIVHKKGSLREPILCEELRKGSGSGERVEGLDVATWKFSNTLGLFNSGEFQACGPKAFLSLQLNGKRDEASLKQATLAIVRQVWGRSPFPQIQSKRG